jgi:hypothetical protein
VPGFSPTARPSLAVPRHKFNSSLPCQPLNGARVAISCAAHTLQKPSGILLHVLMRLLACMRVLWRFRRAKAGVDLGMLTVSGRGGRAPTPHPQHPRLTTRPLSLQASAICIPGHHPLSTNIHLRHIDHVTYSCCPPANTSTGQHPPANIHR